jgi:hypothetical protein
MSKKINQQFTCSKMMLPEHCGQLREHSAAYEKVEACSRPCFDEQLHEEQQRVLDQALLAGQKILVTIIDSSGSHTFCGVPLRIDQVSGYLFLDVGEIRPCRVRAAEITGLIPE